MILLSLTGCFWIYAMWHNFRDGVVSGLGRFVLWTALTISVVLWISRQALAVGAIDARGRGRRRWLTPAVLIEPVVWLSTHALVAGLLPLRVDFHRSRSELESFAKQVVGTAKAQSFGSIDPLTLGAIRVLTCEPNRSGSVRFTLGCG